MAWAPPTAYISSTPATFAAASVYGEMPPSFCGGVTITTRFTPATFAGMQSMSTVEGYWARPPGTYTPAAETGVTFTPKMVPSARDVNHDCSTSRSWNSRICAAAFFKASMNAGSTAWIASSISLGSTRKSSTSTPSNFLQYSRRAASPRSRTSSTIAWADCMMAAGKTPWRGSCPAARRSPGLSVMVFMVSMPFSKRPAWLPGRELFHHSECSQDLQRSARSISAPHRL